MPSSDRYQARVPGSGDCLCAQARTARTRQTGRTSRPRPETAHARPRPDSDASPAPAAPRPAAARPTARPAARSPPAQPGAAPAPGTAPAAHARRARTSPPTAPRPSRRTPAHRACPPPSRRRRNSPFCTPWSLASSQRPDHEVPLRNLIDKALNGATSCCRLIGTSPPPGRAGLPYALHTGKVSWPSPSGGRGNTSMTYEVSRPLMTSVSQLAKRTSPLPAASVQQRLPCRRACR